MKTIISLIFLVCSCWLNVLAGQYSFMHFRNEEGLSNNTVTASLLDSRGFMWFGTKDGLNRFDGINFRVFRPAYNQKDLATHLKHNVIFSLCEDKDSCIWVGTMEGLCCYDPKTDQFTTDEHFPETGITDIVVDMHNQVWFCAGREVYMYNKNRHLLTKQTLSNDLLPVDLCITSDGAVWVVSASCDVYRYDEATQAFEAFHIHIPSTDATSPSLARMIDGGSHGLIVATERDGLYLFDHVSGKVTNLFRTDQDKNLLLIRTIWLAEDGNTVWIGTDIGLYAYRFDRGLSDRIKNDETDPYSLTDNGIRTISRDNEGGLWFGTFYGGLNYLPVNHDAFKKYLPSSLPGHIQGNVIRAICGDTSGLIYIGSEDNGLSWLDPHSGQCTHSSFTYNVHALVCLDNQLWIGTYTNGLFVMDMATKRITPKFEVQFLNRPIVSMLKTKNNDIYIGTSGGIFRYSYKEKQLHDLSHLLGGQFIHDLYEDSQGRIWIASYFGGAHCYHPESGQVTHYTHQPGAATGLSSNHITTIFEDRQGQIWIGTEGGGLCVLQADQTFKCYSLDNGFPSTIISALCEDRKGNLWISTTGGLVKFAQATQKIETYRKADGLIDNHFSYNALYQDGNGRIYLGSLRGLISFHPDMIYPTTYNPPIYITGFYLSKDNRSLTEPGKSILDTKQLTLDYTDASFNVSFVAPSFTHPHHINYRYMLEGYDQNWIYLPHYRSIYYTNVPPGHFRLKVAVMNTDGSWDRETIFAIQIAPPFYLSTWAYMAYIVIGLFIIYGMITSYGRRKKRRYDQIVHELEAQKEKEVYYSRINFFTNITHEIRTPLTLIKIPLDKIIAIGGFAHVVSENLLIIEKNVNRLLSLTNQLLDLRRAEMDMQQLTFARTDICQLLKQTTERFLPSAQESGIQLNYHSPVENYYVVIDPEIITKIFSNLLNNALKYTRDAIDIYIELPACEEDMLRVKFDSNGAHIPEQYAEKIFTPFFKLNMETNIKISKGVGIGLPLSRSLAELHQGRLYLDTQVQNLNSFVLELPSNNPEAIKKENGSLPDKEIDQQREPENINAFNHSILIVDDEKALGHYLATELSNQYNTFVAYNGQMAIEMLRKHPSISLVVSDVVMPVMNGFELCNAIKSTMEYSHIAVILLTAAAGLQARITGLESGADGYIEKPFNIELLRSQIANIFNNRELAVKNFMHTPLSNYKSITINQTDDAFMKRLHAKILDRLSDPTLSVDELAEDMNMSASTLYRKLKAMTNLGANEYIRLYRLKQAAVMLLQREYKINEIAHLTGFSSPSYFTTSFQKQFNITPSEFIKQEFIELKTNIV